MSAPIGQSSVLSQAGPRYDGGPNEGSADIQTQGQQGVRHPAVHPPRYDGGPNEGSADVTTGNGGGKASVMPQTDGFRFGGN